MDDAQSILLRTLLHGRRVAALGTLHEGAPYVSMAPYAIDPTAGVFVVHVSRLAAHTRDMLQDSRVSLLIAQPDDGQTPTQALPRVTVLGEAAELPHGSTSEEAGRAVYLARFPDAAPLTQLGDFSFFAVRPTGARFVAGFAQARTLSAEALAQALRAT